jgi:hypothetical protein
VTVVVGLAAVLVVTVWRLGRGAARMAEELRVARRELPRPARRDRAV